MSQTDAPRPPLPPFDLEGAVQKARMAEDAWNSRDGIDKLTCGRGLALPDRGLSAPHVVANAHSECVFRSNCAKYSHIPITELVNLSIPYRVFRQRAFASWEYATAS